MRGRRRRESLVARIASEMCEFRFCELPAAAVMMRWNGLFGHGFVCAGHARQAEKLGYKIVRPRGAT